MIPNPLPKFLDAHTIFCSAPNVSELITARNVACGWSWRRFSQHLTVSNCAVQLHMTSNESRNMLALSLHRTFLQHCCMSCVVGDIKENRSNTPQEWAALYRSGDLLSNAQNRNVSPQFQKFFQCAHHSRRPAFVAFDPPGVGVTLVKGHGQIPLFLSPANLRRPFGVQN